MTTLRDATLQLERGVNAALGDAITYRFANGDEVTLDAWVEFDTETGGTTNSQAQADALAVEVPMADVPQPSPADRITIAALPGKIWQMTARRRGGTGATWILPLKRAVS